MEKELKKRTFGTHATSELTKTFSQKEGDKGRPTKAQKDLLIKYGISNNLEGSVKNTLDKIMKENIYQAKEALDNLIQYGDTNIYRVLPAELDDKIRELGVVAQEYYGKGVQSLKGTPCYIVPSTYKECSRCGQYKADSSFYTSFSDIHNGRIPFCKKCCSELFKDYLENYGVKEALIVMCQKLDLIVIEEVLTKYIQYFGTPKGKQDVIKGNFFGNFISESFLNLLSKGSRVQKDEAIFAKTNLHGEPFKEITTKESISQIYNDRYAEDDDEDELLTYKPISKLKQKWGDFEKKDLYWLEDKYNEWYDKCEIEGLSREKLVMQLCYEELDVVRTREKGGNVKDKVKSFQSLMKDAELTPKKQRAVSSLTDNQFRTFGLLIKKAEMSGPVISKNKLLSDVDGIERIKRSLAGAAARTLGYDNDYVRQFEDDYKEQTIDLLKSSTDTNSKDGDESG